MAAGSRGVSRIPAAPSRWTGWRSGPGRTAWRNAVVRQLSTTPVSGRRVSLMATMARPRPPERISSSPSRTGRISPAVSRAWARLVPVAEVLASQGCSRIIWVSSQSYRPSWSGFQEATGTSSGTGPPAPRRASRSSTRRRSSTVLPDPGSPRTTSRPVGTRSNTVTRPLPVPASSCGPAPGGVPRVHPAPADASRCREAHGWTSEASAGCQDTARGGRVRSRRLASADHWAVSWSASRSATGAMSMSPA